MRLRAAEIEALAAVYNTDTRAHLLLERTRYPRSRYPINARTPADFWHSVDRALADGILPGGREQILAVARQDYPGNSAFENGPAGEAQIPVGADGSQVASDGAGAAGAHPGEPPAMRVDAPGGVLIFGGLQNKVYGTYNAAPAPPPE